MNKALKMFLAVIGGVIGTCAIIWFASTTAGSLQEASARGETFGVILGIMVFAGIGIFIFKYFTRE